MAYVAGAHSVVDQVWKIKSESSSSKSKAPKDQHQMLQAFLKKIVKDKSLTETLTDFLSEEDLYPFGAEWPEEVIAVLVSQLKAPQLNAKDAFDDSTNLRFVKGYHKTLLQSARTQFSMVDEDTESSFTGSLDHWLSMIINGAYHCGAVAAARASGGSDQAFYTALSTLEEEDEPWARYDQLSRIYENEVTRSELGEDQEDDDDDGSDDDDGDEGLYLGGTRKSRKPSRKDLFDFDPDDDYEDDDYSNDDEAGHDPFDDYE